MATPDLSKFTIDDLVYDAGVPFRAFTAEEAVAELTRRMTPPPGCVRTPEGKDLKMLGELPMTADGCVVGYGARLYSDCGIVLTHYITTSAWPSPPAQFDDWYSTLEASKENKE